MVLPVACFAAAAQGHEFWIDPEKHQISPGEDIVAAIRVGQNYKGFSFSYLPAQFRRFEFVLGEDSQPVKGTMGDRPAVTMAAPGEGLVVLVHETTDKTLTYSEFQKFEDFVTHKGADWTLDAHATRGLPPERFKEVYSRYAKSLVGVGGSQGQDRAVGLEVEIVALENPYTGEMADGFDALVLYRGEPWAEAQVEIFEKPADGEVAVSTLITDSEGRVTVPVLTGHRYMLDAVVLREPSAELAEATGAVWESLWANLTFEVKER